tara:strand:+ start:1569 stop:2609 length:1041 start_codon:yes stop_codon:yes gene_type:complete
MMKKILITGVGGFIGFHLCKKLLDNKKYEIIGYDNLNNYYDPNLKKDRINELNRISKSLNRNWIFIKGDLENKKKIYELFSIYEPQIVVNLAAQAGVRYSIENPKQYIDSNISGFLNILECCKNHQINNLIYASSSSVYGGNKKVPFSEKDTVNHPVSLYAATKKSNELMAHVYSHLYKIPSTGLRLFTVYGPWGRPDMAPMIFTKAIFSNREIEVFNNGLMSRDFTYIDDVIEIIVRIIEKPAVENNKFNKLYPEADSSWAPHKIFNVGNNSPVKLTDFIEILEEEIGIKARKIMKPIQPGDVITTYADVSSIEEWINYIPKTNLKKGIQNFISWYKKYYRISVK